MRISRSALGTSAMAGLASLVTLASLGSPARAVVITIVDPDPEIAGDWNVTTTRVFAGTDPYTFIRTFIKPPWEGSEAIAGKFALALGGKEGYPNPGSVSPYFAYAALIDPPENPLDPVVATYQAAGTFRGGVAYSTFSPGSTDPDSPPPNNFYTYATATRVISDVPGPLPVLGGLAAFGWSRRLRRRVALPTRP